MLIQGINKAKVKIEMMNQLFTGDIILNLNLNLRLFFENFFIFPVRKSDFTPHL